MNIMNEIKLKGYLKMDRDETLLILTNSMLSSNKNISIFYPVITGMKDEAVQQRINNTILYLVNKLIIDQGYYQNTVDTMIGDFEIKNNQRGFLSLSISNYTYIYHAAHGNTIIKSLTFNLKDGSIYTLADLFKPGSNYQKILSDIIAKQIAERKIDILEYHGIAPDQDFYIADRSLVVYFQLYQITPYVFGFPFFPISVYELSDIIRDGTPLAVMSENR